MRKIYCIAKTELQNLFYSPIAWLVIIIFTFQCSSVFGDLYVTDVKAQELGYHQANLTLDIFTSYGGLLPAVQNYLYLYIPLLTMGLMSRETGSGSIKLLYSSPVTNTQIVLGKYLSVMIYALALIGVLMIYALFTWFTMKDFDFPAVLSGYLGIYLLICAYGAIGLFMSSLTSYPMVAAIGTLAVLSVLNYVHTMGQAIDFVRDITYWLSIQGRTDDFISGMICTEDFMYFILVIFLFLSWTVIKLSSSRMRASSSAVIGKYIGVFALVAILGYITSRPVCIRYWDLTRTKSNTLTENSRNIVKDLKGDLTITSYVNLLDQNNWIALPVSRNTDLHRMEKYLRFKPETKMKYVYYYDHADNEDLDKRYPGMSDEERAKELCKVFDLDFDLFKSPEEIRRIVDLSEEGNRFVRILESENGRKAVLRVYDDAKRLPTESEITIAMKKLIMPMPKVGFLTGHGERSTTADGDRNYKRFAQDRVFRYSMINQGFDFEEVNLVNPVADDITILIVGDPRTAFNDTELQNLHAYIERGGNLLIAADANRQEVMNPVLEPLGVNIKPGILVQPSENYLPDFLRSIATDEGCELMYVFEQMKRSKSVITMPGTGLLEYTGDRGFDVTPVLVTDSVPTWNELEVTDFVNDSVSVNPAIGEEVKTYPTMLAMSRMVGDREQKIIVLADADCLSNSEVGIYRKGLKAANFYIIAGVFHWLSDGAAPMDVRRPVPPDDHINLGLTSVKVWFNILLYGVPAMLLFLAVGIWLRRRGR
ncbi:MAG: Gldg family protein [Muribaculaceae bacterium]|nr:Gldg family protein [Muribaculaceae bacterium]